VGAAYERRIYAFRFETTATEDDAFIAWMNDDANRSHFNLVVRNCADFSSAVLDFYFPHAYKRHIAPDGGITTPRQVAYALVRYARKHPEMRLEVLEIPQVPGYRRPSRESESVFASLIMTGDVVPLAVLNPFLAGAVLADTFMWGRYPLPLKHAALLKPEDMELLWSAANVSRSPHSERGQTQVATVR
jgi:hypothetical protein